MNPDAIPDPPLRLGTTGRLNMTHKRLGGVFGPLNCAWQSLAQPKKRSIGVNTPFFKGFKG